MFDELFGKAGLSLDRLQTLCEVAEKGSIGQATKGDSNRQTQFSRQIGELEKFFGVELLNRDSRPYRLSEEGKELAQISRGYLSSLSDFQANCSNRPVRLVIGAGESIIQWLLMPMLEQLANEIPEASISMRNLRTNTIIQDLTDGDIDLGLVRKSAVAKPLKSVGKWEYGYRLFIPKRMRTKFTGKLTVSQLTDLPLAVIGGGGEFRQQLAALAKAEDAHINDRLECSSYSQIATAILGGSYCGFLPRFASRYLPEDRFRSFEVTGFESLRRELVFAWNPKHEQLRPIVGRVVELLGKS